MHRSLVGSLLIACIAFCSPVSAEQIFDNLAIAAPVLEIDPSIRSAAMGGASTAVSWGIDPNYWANPSLLGYARGIRYEQGSTDYGFVEFRSRRTTLGW